MEMLAGGNSKTAGDTRPYPEPSGAKYSHRWSKRGGDYVETGADAGCK